MLELSYGLNFFLKSPKNRAQQIRSVYLRVTVNGIPKETSTKMRWDNRRWDQQTGRAIGNKEDAKTLNFFLDGLVNKINQYRTSLLNEGKTITSTGIIDYLNGRTISNTKLLEEFQKHNDELFALIGKGVALGTHKRYVTARSHVKDYIVFKYRREDLEFRELNYEFVVDYEFYLKTVRQCAHNTALKYISNLKKIVLRAVSKEIIAKNPFALYKSKKVKVKKQPLTSTELKLLEKKMFDSERLTTVRDIFVFQCYTGLAYIDVLKLRKDNIQTGVDGKLWIMSKRQKTDSVTDIPLLPKALEILEKYKGHPQCLEKALPVKSNQKMNEYLKEIAVLCGIKSTLNTHKARRTFASTVTLNNGVPIHVVKELLGHYSVRQTEEYALTEHLTIGMEMAGLTEKLKAKDKVQNPKDLQEIINKLQSELEGLKALQLKSGQYGVVQP